MDLRLDALVNFMKQQGVYEVYLPFLLTFSIFFALLRKTKIFYSKQDAQGKYEDDKIGNNISIVVSVVAALFVTVFTPAGITMSYYFSMFFTQASIAMVAIIVFLMIGSLLMTNLVNPNDQQKLEDVLKQWTKYMIGFAVLLVIFMFANSGGINLFTKWGLRIPYLDQGDFGVILLVIGTGVIIALATHEKRPPVINSGGSQGGGPQRKAPGG